MTEETGTLTLSFWKKEPMSKEGLMAWSPHLRGRVKKTIWAKDRRHNIVVPVDEIDTREKLADFTADYVGVGYWRVRTWTHAKTKYHGKFVPIAEVKVRYSEKLGYMASVTTIQFKSKKGRMVTRLPRFKWWRG